MNRISILFLLLLVTPVALLADEIRPAYLELRETAPTVYAVIWKVPARGESQLGLNPVFPVSCLNKSEPTARNTGNAFVYHWLLACDGSLVNQAIAIDGLERTLTDVLVRVEHLDGSSQSARLRPQVTSFRVEAQDSSLDIVTTYLLLGIEHILSGVDHLLFVFALLIIVVDFRKLAWTITAFTLAHSITLAGATLGLLHVPQQPVEAVIALSILFLATEILHGHQGRDGYTKRWPWLVAFIFGLLHGFGFAGALSAVGLPERAIPLALVFFNIGVEFGQLIFVAAVLVAGRLLNHIKVFPLQLGERLVTYLIGSLAAYWTIDRFILFWA